MLLRLIDNAKACFCFVGGAAWERYSLSCRACLCKTKPAPPDNAIPNSSAFYSSRGGELLRRVILYVMYYPETLFFTVFGEFRNGMDDEVVSFDWNEIFAVGMFLLLIKGIDIVLETV